MEAEYNDRIIAFIDLQGFSDRVKSISSDNEFAEILDLLKILKKTEAPREPDKFLSKLKNIFSIEENIEMAKGYRASAVSDCIIISYPKSSANLYALIIELMLIQWTVLFRFNYLIRGFITAGKCYHDNGILFGEGYMRAYSGCELNKLHKMPCIAFDQGVFEILNEKHHEVLFHYKREDDYAFPYLNYALALLRHKEQIVPESPADFYQVQEALKFIKRGLDENLEQEAVHEKYQWTLDYLNYMLQLK